MSKRKKHATHPQQRILDAFLNQGATSAAAAVKPALVMPTNAVNRLRCRGWLAKGCEAGTLYVTPEGLAASAAGLDAVA